MVCRSTNGEVQAFEAEKVLVAVGRGPNTASLGLETGMIKHSKGSILVNDKMETSLPGVYAVGDCVKGYSQLAHTASAMGEVAAENALGGSMHYDESSCPTCVYIEPEAASVGLTEEAVQGRRHRVHRGQVPHGWQRQGLILNGGEGVMKILADRNDRVLGMHIIGPRATDLIAEGALAIEAGLSIDTLIATIHSHPTVTEAMREATLSVQHRAIHIVNR